MRGRQGRAVGRACGRGEVAARRQRVAGARVGTAWARRGARQGARSARGTAGLGVAWALEGCAGWVNWAKLVHCAPGSVLTRFLDPV